MWNSYVLKYRTLSEGIKSESLLSVIASMTRQGNRYSSPELVCLNSALSTGMSEPSSMNGKFDYKGTFLDEKTDLCT